MPVLFSVLSGFVTGFTFPTAFAGKLLPDVGWAAWFSLVPLYLSLKATSGNSAVKALAFGAGIVSVSCYYLFLYLPLSGKMGWGAAVFLTCLLISLLSLLFSFFCAAAVRIHQRGVPLWLSLPLGWVCFDFLRNYFPFGGVPLTGMAYTQRSFLPLIQLLDVTGIYGITFLLVLGNCWLGELGLWLRKKTAFPALLSGVFLSLFALSLVYGFNKRSQIESGMAQLEKVQIALIQGNVAPRKTWSPDSIQAATDKYFSLSLRLKNPTVDLFIWPETPQPTYAPSGQTRLNRFKGLEAPLLFNIMTHDGDWPPHWPPSRLDYEKGFALFNSAILVSEDGTVQGEYRKYHLAPFGEYVPLRRLFKNFEAFALREADFSAGEALRPMPFPTRRGLRTMGIMICLEDMFPEIARRYARQGVDLLVNLTNGGWYGGSSAIFQHFDYSRYRAIESRRSVARATNTGVTALIAPTGEILAQAPTFSEAAVIAAVPLGGPSTLYTRWGDLPALACAIAFGTLLLSSFFIRRSRLH
jgi:apolipoprotein N-acyltransferase